MGTAKLPKENISTVSWLFVGIQPPGKSDGYPKYIAIFERRYILETIIFGVYIYILYFAGGTSC